MKTLLSSGIACLFALGCGAGMDGTTNDVELTQEPIIGGSTDNGDPSVVAIFAHQPGSNQGSLCTGAVISPRAVLTAAHCVDPRVVGDGNIFEVRTGTYLSSSSILEVESTDFDPAFDPENLSGGHDIAVVRLAQDTTLTALPYNRGALGTGSVRIVGYGTNTHSNTGSGTKRQATTTIGDNNSILVVIGTTSKQTCHGDSGGPAFQTINGQERIIGVTSYGQDIQPFYYCFGGGVDTRVDAYTSFIDSHL